MAIDDLNRLFPHDVPGDDMETVGGFVINQLGRIPQRGERVECGGLVMQIMDARPNKIERIWVKWIDRTWK